MIAYIPHFPQAAEVTCSSLQSWLTDPFDAFCYVSPVAHDYALHTPDEPRDNPFDIDQPGISCVIPCGWPGSFSDISYSSCIADFPGTHPGFLALFPGAILLILYSVITWYRFATVEAGYCWNHRENLSKLKDADFQQLTVNIF